MSSNVYSQRNRQSGQNHHRDAEAVNVSAAGAFEGTDRNSVAIFVLVEDHDALRVASKGMLSKERTDV